MNELTINANLKLKKFQNNFTRTSKLIFKDDTISGSSQCLIRKSKNRRLILETL